jgi:methionyl aminopeptidase
VLGRRRPARKSREEILLMRAAGLVVARALDLVVASARPGMTTGALDALAEELIRSEDARPSFPEVPGYRHTLCTSVNDEVVHGIPGARVLAEGDLLSVDCGAIYQGWHGDAAVSVIVGGAGAGRPEDLELIAATEDSLWAGAAALAVGAPLHDVGAAVEDSIHASGERAGRVYGIVEDYVGHAIGREMHLDPQIPNYRVHGSSPTVRDTFTGAIEPMVTLGTDQTRVLADGWTVVTVDGTRAAHWEHTVLVREEGLWVLTAHDGGQARLQAHGARFAPVT